MTKREISGTVYLNSFYGIYAFTLIRILLLFTSEKKCILQNCLLKNLNH